MIELYFFRHGPAGSKSGWTGEDAERPLTARGREITVGVARRLAEAGLELDVIVTSPYVRARQTAEIASSALHVGSALETDDLLMPGFGPQELRSILARHPDAHRIMLVGHEGDFSSVVGRLIGSADLVLRKAGVAMVELADAGSEHGTLRWLAPPSLLA
ncbi:MAG TPA: histidine phosphatase family protein [Coriobacteriia bacterium]